MESTICGRTQHNLWLDAVAYSSIPAAKMSAVWKYFKLEHESSPTSTCNVCNASISRGSSNRAAFNTTNMIRHLKNKHSTEYSEFTQAKAALKQQTLGDTFKEREISSRQRQGQKDYRIIELIALFM